MVPSQPRHRVPRTQGPKAKAQGAKARARQGATRAACAHKQVHTSYFWWDQSGAVWRIPFANRSNIFKLGYRGRTHRRPVRGDRGPGTGPVTAVRDHLPTTSTRTTRGTYNRETYRKRAQWNRSQASKQPHQQSSKTNKRRRRHARAINRTPRAPVPAPTNPRGQLPRHTSQLLPKPCA